LNTDSPGPQYTSGWPTSQQSPDVCSGANSPACSYDYGWNAAQVSFNNALSAEAADGASSPNASVVAAKWWLDVETGNHWETIESLYGPTKGSDAIDQAELQGTIAYLTSVGVTQIGIYCTSSQWKTITGGNTGSTFAAFPAWLPGYPSLAAAEAACLDASFNGGRVAMIQYPSRGLDGDYICGLVSTPATASVAVAESASFTQQLAVIGNVGTVTYVQTGGSPNLVVSPTGLITTNGALAPGTYDATGTTSDPNGDNGTYSFVLTVGTITQTAPLSASATVPGAATFSQQLADSGSDGAVTYVQSTGSPDLVVSPTGLITTDGSLAKGSYSVSGTTSDANGDKGKFAYTLKVGTITQSTPTSISTSMSESTSFTHQLVVTGNDNPATFIQTVGTPNLVVSSTGLLTVGAELPVGSYVARGTTSDGNGDTGTFFYNLIVTADVVVPTTTGPVATHVVGYAVAGRSVSLAIVGSGFFGRPHVSSHSGTTALVTKDSGTLLIVKVTVTPRSRNGTFTFTIRLSDGKQCQVKYQQRH
jgi:major membrane immunogen (membrane-anchored lipoprotein)